MTSPRPSDLARSHLERADPRALIATSAAVTAIWMTWWPSIQGMARLALVVVAIGTYAIALVAVERMPPCALSDPVGRFALTAVVLLLAVAVWLEPRGSQDLWSYVLYGRTVAIHHVSPYTHAPASFPGDPFLARVSRGWRDSRSVYGPLFTAYSAAGAALAGGSALTARLCHQALAAASVLAVGVAVARRRRDVLPVIFLALNPAVIAVVNGGHNDLVVGALVAASVALGGRRHAIAAGLVVSFAILVKVIALLPAVALVVWLWHRVGRRAAAAAAATVGLTVGAGYLLAGGMAALAPFRASAQFASRASVWSIPHKVIGRLPDAGLGSEAASLAKVSAILVAVTAVAVLGRQRWLTAASPAPGVVATLSTLVFALPYVLPWYSGWVLPTSALIPQSRLARFARWQSLALLLAYVYPPGASSGSLAVDLVTKLALPCCVAAIVFSLVSTPSEPAVVEGSRRPGARSD